MSSNNIRKKKAGDIISKNLIDKCPNIKNFMNILLADIDLENVQVGKMFSYRLTVASRCQYISHGLVMDFFIRKVLAQKHKLNLKDDYAEKSLKNVDLYFTPEVKRTITPKNFKEQYEIFKDPKTQAMEIIRCIKNISVSKMIYLKDYPLSLTAVETNNDNLLEVKKYFENLRYTDAELKYNIECEYFEGKADIIFDKKVLYEIKTSKNSFQTRLDFRVKSNFQKLLLYGFGYYKKTGIIIKKYVIYNPLLGQELILRLNDIDMIHFEQVLDKDIKKLLNIR